MTKAATRQDRITVDPDILHGKPAIRGMRMSVQSVLELLAAGSSFAEILEDYPYLEQEDLLAALGYGAAISGGQLIHTAA